MHCVTVKHRLRKSHVAHAEVCDSRAERRVADADANDEAESKNAVDQRPAEFGGLGEFGVEVQRLRVHRHRRNSTLSVSVTVRVIACSNTWPSENSSK